MKFALAQVNVHIGNFESNFQKFVGLINSAKSKDVDVIIFPELAICGYPPRDFLDYQHFVKQCDLYIAKLAKECVSITAIIGSPSFNIHKEGKALHNSAYVLADGTIKNIIHKSLLPTYDIFDEYRYFQPAPQLSCIEINGKKIALTICEDLWNTDDQKLYVQSPMDVLINEQPDLMINIAASPFDYNQNEKRKNVLKWNAKKYNLPLLYVNNVGAQTELIFDGCSMALNSDAEIIAESKMFEEDLLIIDSTELSTKKSSEEKNIDSIELIHDAIVLGIKDYFQKSGFKKAVLGLSGGIDSAVVAALAARALGNENVLGVLMPSQYSSDHSVDDAIALADNLKIQHQIIPIKDVYHTYKSSLSITFEGLAEDLTEENLQARIRGVLLMAVSNKFGNILLNTSNKSEAAVGYGTLYGDMCGGISVIGDVYKTQVYALANFINKDQIIIPVNTIEKAPSAELRPDQKDSDSLPDYDILDEVLDLYIEHSISKDELIDMGFDKALIDRITSLVNRNEYKRYQTPPILRVSSKAFGMGRRMPIVAKY